MEVIIYNGIPRWPTKFQFKINERTSKSSFDKSHQVGMAQQTNHSLIVSQEETGNRKEEKKN